MPTGMKLKIALPIPGPQPRRLLETIPRLPPIEDRNAARWLEGVTWEPWECRMLTVGHEDDCGTGADLGSIVPAVCQTAVSQVPFRIADAYKMSVLNENLDEIGLRQTARYNLQISAIFAHELIAGSGTGVMSLSNQATPPNGAAFGAAAVTTWYGLQVLEEEIAERLQGGIGLIHTPPGLLGRFVMESGVHLNALNQWETPAGNIVIADAGYMNPVQPTGGGGASAVTTDWVYASGPVFFEATMPILLDPAFVGGTTAAAWNRDIVQQFVEGYGILVFDPCPVTAVLVTY